MTSVNLWVLTFFYLEWLVLTWWVTVLTWKCLFSLSPSTFLSPGDEWLFVTGQWLILTFWVTSWWSFLPPCEAGFSSFVALVTMIFCRVESHELSQHICLFFFAPVSTLGLLFSDGRVAGGEHRKGVRGFRAGCGGAAPRWTPVRSRTFHHSIFVILTMLMVWLYCYSAVCIILCRSRWFPFKCRAEVWFGSCIILCSRLFFFSWF